MSKEVVSSLGGSWEDFEREIFTPDEIAASRLRVAIMGELVKARKDVGVSQKRLEDLSGVRQPVIARLETGSTNPTIGTVLKLLAPLGKTLAVVPIEERQTA